MLGILLGSEEKKILRAECDCIAAAEGLWQWIRCSGGWGGGLGKDDGEVYLSGDCSPSSSPVPTEEQTQDKVVWVA